MSSFIKLVALAVLAYAGWALYQRLQPHESAEEVARKPAAIAVAVHTARERCDTQAQLPQRMAYDSRLAGILKYARTDAIEEVNRRGIAICLDQRLGRQDTRLLDQVIMGVYYPQAQMVTLRDDGGPSQHNNWFASYAVRFVETVVDTLAYEVGSFGADAPMFASMEDSKPPRTIWREQAAHSKQQIAPFVTAPAPR